MVNNSSSKPEVSGPENWQIFLASISYVIVIVSSSLNLLIVYVISRRKELRTPTNAFIASLVIGEIIFGMFSLPFAAASLLENSWPFSDSTCKGSAFMQVLGRTSSSYCLVFVCLDRYIAVSRPLKYTNIVTATFSIVSVISIWSFSLFVSLLLLLIWDSYRYADVLFLCTVEQRVDNLGSLVKDVISIFIPTCLTLSCLVFIVKEVKSHHRIFAIFPMPVIDKPSVQVESGNTAPCLFPLSRIMVFNRNTRKALRSFFVMVLSYVVFCLPCSISGRLQACASQGVGHAAILVSVWLSFLYTTVNPVIIISFNKKFCSRLKLICGWWQCNKVHPSQEVFTISSGLQTILDTTLIKNLGQGGKTSSTYSVRRSALIHTS